MIIRGFLVLTLFAQYGLPANTQTRKRSEPSISECAAKGGECDETRGRPVCGTDDQTYPTRCHLLRVQCSGHQVSLKYRGPCRACKEAREYALKHRSKSTTKFVPHCRTDGTYAPIQCLGDSGCWCSDMYGKPIEGTSVRTGKPKCREYNRANIRRSTARHLSPNRSRRPCNQADRVAFNSNLLKVFQSEYARSAQTQPPQKQRDAAAVGLISTATDKMVLDWKFMLLDTNANGVVDKIEFRELKKLVKRAIKPRRCGRAFGKFCDANDDGLLTRFEWNNCLAKDGVNGHHHTRVNNHKFNAYNNDTNHGYIHQQNTKSSGSNNNNSNNNKNHSNNNNHNNVLTYHNQFHNSANNHHNIMHNNNNRNSIHTSALDALNNESNAEEDESNQHIDYEDDPDYNAEDDEDEHNIGMANTFGLPSNFPSIDILRPKPESPLKESEGESDCLADQTAALEEQRNGATIFYVPECTPDGRYQRVQCYHSTPYCWCVHEDSGKNIPGTSVKNQRPQCDAITPVTRPMKGCPEPKKSIFLKELKEFLNFHMLSNSVSGINATNWSSEDERVASLSFVLLDKNKNKILERKEWKTFRELIMSSKTLRKCGKKMPRYCDVNSDKKLTLTEWMSCLQPQKAEVEQQILQTSTPTNKSETSKPSKLIGSNPLEQYLKD